MKRRAPAKPQRWRCLLWFVVAISSACGATPRGPYFDDDRLIHFGVDAQTEAAEVQAAFDRKGYRRTARLVGAHFTALAFADEGSDKTAVRVVTARGIALALDGAPADALSPASAYALVRRPVDGTHDADGDGFDEVFVRERGGDEVCLRLYRVRDSGFVDPVPLRLSATAERELCVLHADDDDGDGRVALRATWTLTGVPLPIQPTMPVLLVPSGHAYVPAQGPDAYRAETATAELELSEALASNAIDLAYAQITRLAALQGLSGSDEHGQVAELEAGFARLPSAARRQDWERALRARFAAGAIGAASPGRTPAAGPGE